MTIPRCLRPSPSSTLRPAQRGSSRAFPCPALPVGLPSLGWTSGVLSILLALGCGGGAPPETPASAGGAECPKGQTFDGQFCRVDGELAQSEPLPEPTSEEGAASQESSKEEEPEGEPGGATTTAGAEAAGEPDDSEEALTAGEATPVDVSMAAQAGPVITYLAGSHLPAGAQPLGAPFAAQFAEGQRFEQKVQLTTGRCYTIVAAGIPPVRDVNIELLADGQEEPAAKDDAVGPQAVLGSRNQCFKAERAEMTLVITVVKGQGVVAGQVFEK